MGQIAQVLVDGDPIWNRLLPSVLAPLNQEHFLPWWRGNHWIRLVVLNAHMPEQMVREMSPASPRWMPS